VIAEAKAAALPVIALFAGGLAGTVRSGIDGYLTVRDIATYVDHIKKLLSDEKLLVRMSIAAKEDAHLRFSARSVAIILEDLYKKLKS